MRVGSGGELRHRGLPTRAAAQGSWKIGRASFYGDDGGSIHNGNCGFGYQYPNVGTGYDVAAVADASPEFAGSCGRCYEVRCQARTVVDGYGNSVDRSGVCKVGQQSVVVRTVDSCPCVYPANAYSNKRWCCGDNAGTQGTHLDLSIWAFEKLADPEYGVIGIEWRRVPCSYRSPNPAPAPDSPTPMYEEPPAGAPPPSAMLYVKRFDDGGGSQGAVKQVAPSNAASYADQPTVDYSSLFQGGQPYSSSVSASASASASAGNGCTDTPPQGQTCQQVLDWNKCGENYVIAGTYCRQSCGRCQASPPAPSSASGPSAPSQQKQRDQYAALVAAFSGGAQDDDSATTAVEDGSAAARGGGCADSDAMCKLRASLGG